MKINHETPELVPVELEFDSEDLARIREAAQEKGQTLDEFLRAATADFLKPLLG